MKTSTRFTTILNVIVLTSVVGCTTTHQEIGSDDHPSSSAPKSATQDKGAGEMKMSPQMEADMKACMTAGTPGKQHELLARTVGNWTGTCKMWMAPDTEPMTSPMSSTVSTIMDGRYVKCEIKSDMPGMGPFLGLGFSGFDNVVQKYVSTWIDSMSTGIMEGEGTMSADGKTLTWNCQYNCPITKKAAKMRQVETRTGDNSMTLDMYGNDPHSGKEFQMMHIELKRQSP